MRPTRASLRVEEVRLPVADAAAVGGQEDRGVIEVLAGPLGDPEHDGGARLAARRGEERARRSVGHGLRHGQELGAVQVEIARRGELGADEEIHRRGAERPGQA
jgi:hypothetical protein